MKYANANTNTNKSAPKTNRHTGREIGLELRKTHFVLGIDDPKFSSQYRNDYIPKKSGFENNNQTFLNPNLKKDQMKLGIHNDSFITSSMAQNMDLEARRKNFKMVHLDENLKNELRSSHFLLGNSNPNYQTVFQSQYYAKNNQMNNFDKLNSNNFNKPMGHKMGKDKVDYNSETHVKYSNPQSQSLRNLNNNNQEKKINSQQELQNSHYAFGNDSRKWMTTSGYFFNQKTPVDNTNPNHLKDGKINLGNDQISYQTSQNLSHPKFDSLKNIYNRDAALELRKHSIILGNDSSLPYKISKNTEDYSDPRLKNNLVPSTKLDNKNLRNSHFSISDPHQAPINQYETSYGFNMINNKNLNLNKPITDKHNKNNNQTNSASANILGNGPCDYATENRSRFSYKVNNIKEKEIAEIRGIINNIRGHHWDHGSKNGSFTTTNNEFLKYNDKLAKMAAVPLNEEQKNDLRHSHHQLGKGSIPFSTTHIDSYLNSGDIKKTTWDPNLKKSHIEFNPKNSNLRDKTVYMTDYTVKECVE